MGSVVGEKLTRAIEEALSRLGQPITEGQARNVAALEDCDCKDGMFALAATRRQLFAGTGLVAAVGMTAMLHSNSPPRPTTATAAKKISVVAQVGALRTLAQQPSMPRV
jgi:hypothetical protein